MGNVWAASKYHLGGSSAASISRRAVWRGGSWCEGRRRASAFVENDLTFDYASTVRPARLRMGQIKVAHLIELRWSVAIVGTFPTCPAVNVAPDDRLSARADSLGRTLNVLRTIY